MHVNTPAAPAAALARFTIERSFMCRAGGSLQFSVATCATTRDAAERDADAAIDACLALTRFEEGFSWLHTGCVARILLNTRGVAASDPGSLYPVPVKRSRKRNAAQCVTPQWFDSEDREGSTYVRLFGVFVKEAQFFGAIALEADTLKDGRSEGIGSMLATMASVPLVDSRTWTDLRMYAGHLVDVGGGVFLSLRDEKFLRRG